MDTVTACPGARLGHSRAGEKDLFEKTSQTGRTRPTREHLIQRVGLDQSRTTSPSEGIGLHGTHRRLPRLTISGGQKIWQAALIWLCRLNPLQHGKWTAGQDSRIQLTTIRLERTDFIQPGRG